jgi:energy-coupling factor transporter ATP-binding protein EcfA2
MRITHLLIDYFPPFAPTQVEFPALEGISGEVHLFTGANGSGKTRLLSLLAASLGNHYELQQRTDGDYKKLDVNLVAIAGPSIFLWGLRNGSVRGTGGLQSHNPLEGVLRKKELFYNQQSISVLTEFWQPQPLALAFQGMTKVSNSDVQPMKTLSLGDRREHLRFEAAQGADNLIAQCMTNLKMQAAMESMSEDSNGRAKNICQRLETVVTRITGREFTFSVTPHPKVSLVAKWGGVSMRMGQLPDGLRSIIGWLVACAAKLEAANPEHPDPLSLPLILLLDEPEGHLHPRWQRQIIPAARALFPEATIYLATHSPFVISSVNEGWIHIFKPQEDGSVVIEKARECSKGDTFLDVVEDILGVSEWYDPETEALLNDFRKLRDSVLSGRWEAESALREKSSQIASRSPSLDDMMAREMRKVDRAKSNLKPAA